MDPARRKALEERRRRMNAQRAADEKARARALRRAQLSQVTGALDAAGEAFELREFAEDCSWQPGWLPSGASEFLWHRSPRATQVDHDGDPASEADAIILSLRRIAEPEEPVVLAFRWERLTIRTTCEAVERRIETILERLAGGAQDLWIAHAAGKWIIRSDRKWTWTHLPPERLALDDHEIWAAVHVLIREHREGAHAFARSLAQANAIRDDRDGLALWAEVADRIKMLMTGNWAEGSH